MRFLVVIVLLAFIANFVLSDPIKAGPVVTMSDLKEVAEERFKRCTCIKETSGFCKKLKCCDIFKYVPYEMSIKYCKFGKCEFVEKKVAA